MLFITSQTSPREFTLKRHCWRMGLHSSPQQHCIRFPCNKEIFFSLELLSWDHVLPVITRTIFASLIFSHYTTICCCYIELFSHQIRSSYKMFVYHDPRMLGYCKMKKRLENNGKEIITCDGNSRTHGWRLELHIQWQWGLGGGTSGALWTLEVFKQIEIDIDILGKLWFNLFCSAPEVAPLLSQHSNHRL